jgi:hypothetical protein
MSFPLDPTFQPSGPPFLTAPDGTTAPDQGGTEVDVTGVPLTVAPQSNAVQTGAHATILAFGAGVLTVGGLTSISPASVGRLLTLAAAANAGNVGTFPIVAVLGPTVVQVADAGGSSPDANSGSIAWVEALDPTAFAPGDPLTFLADQLTPFQLNQQTFGPARGGGSAILPPNVNVDAPVGQPTGKGTGPVAPTGGTGGDVQSNSGFPVRIVASSSLTVDRDPLSPAYGLEPSVQDGPAVSTPEPFSAVPERGASPEVLSPGGGMIYAPVSQVVFSR